MAKKPAAPKADMRVTKISLFSNHVEVLFLRIILLLALSSIAWSQTVVETLPGYTGKLPFKLETGYIGVGDSEEVQLFYYFIESARNPETDPLLLWLTGGPGCSGLSGLLFEIGPFTFDYSSYNIGNLPTVVLNPYSWTKVANIIFLDAPVGTGFSYSETSDGYYSSDTKTAYHIYEFLQKWLMSHPSFMMNQFYMSGDSYSGKIVPTVTLEITKGIGNNTVPKINLQGYIIGNPVTDNRLDDDAWIPFAHRTTLISDELHKSVQANCKGEYFDVDSSNVQCITDMRYVMECISKIYPPQILEPNCYPLDFQSTEEFRSGRLFPRDIPIDVFRSNLKDHKVWNRCYNYVLSYIWANDETVQEALRIRNGTKYFWTRCNKSLAYEKDILNVVEYHRILSSKHLRALVYSGDHDMLIPYVGTRTWIETLNFTVADVWRPWFVDAQVAGFTESYAVVPYTMDFATVKGGGHTAPEYRPKQCLHLIDRWLDYYSL